MYHADNNDNSHAQSYVMMAGRGKNAYGTSSQRLAAVSHRQSFVYSPQQKQQLHNQSQSHHHHHNNHHSQQNYRHQNQINQAQIVESSQYLSNIPFVQASNVSLKRNFMDEYSLQAGYQRFNYNTRQRHYKTPVSFDDERYQKQLIVNYLAPNVSSEELHKLFSCFGPLDGARIIYDRQTKLTKGYGFVYFCYPESARRAVEQMNGFEFHGKRLKVGYSTNPLNIVSGVTPQYAHGGAIS